MAREVIYGLSIIRIWTVRIAKGIYKELFTVRKLHFIQWDLKHFHGKSVHIRFVEPYGPYGSQKLYTAVKNFLRSVNCISLVELRIFSWQERSYMVCRSVRTVRIAKVIYGDYFKLFFTQNSHDVN